MTISFTTPARLKMLAPIVACTVYLVITLTSIARAESIIPFLGSYSGSADLIEANTVTHRDMSVEITGTDDGFSVSWTSGTYKPDGRIKEKSYNIEFVTSDREDIFASAMQTNVFGKQVPLDPLKGEPFVWARLVDDTLSIFSLFISEIGDYEMQEYHRTLVDGGLNLEFVRFRNGIAVRTVETLLERK